MSTNKNEFNFELQLPKRVLVYVRVPTTYQVPITFLAYNDLFAVA